MDRRASDSAVGFCSVSATTNNVTPTRLVLRCLVALCLMTLCAQPCVATISQNPSVQITVQTQKSPPSIILN
jgi:hypothetical protein